MIELEEEFEHLQNLNTPKYVVCFILAKEAFFLLSSLPQFVCRRGVYLYKVFKRFDRKSRLVDQLVFIPILIMMLICAVCQGWPESMHRVSGPMEYLPVFASVFYFAWVAILINVSDYESEIRKYYEDKTNLKSKYGIKILKNEKSRLLICFVWLLQGLLIRDDTSPHAEKIRDLTHDLIKKYENEYDFEKNIDKNVKHEIAYRSIKNQLFGLVGNTIFRWLHNISTHPRKNTSRFT